MLSGGRYPTIGLKTARSWRDAAKAQLARGLDPSAERRADKELLRVKAANSFEEVAREWLRTRTLGWSPCYAGLVFGRLESDIFPVLGEIEISAITPRMILDAIRQIEARGAVEMAHRVKTMSAKSSASLSPTAAARAIHVATSRRLWPSSGRFSILPK
jgi:integrase